MSTLGWMRQFSSTRTLRIFLTLLVVSTVFRRAKAFQWEAFDETRSRGFLEALMDDWENDDVHKLFNDDSRPKSDYRPRLSEYEDSTKSRDSIAEYVEKILDGPGTDVENEDSLHSEISSLRKDEANGVDLEGEDLNSDQEHDIMKLFQYDLAELKIRGDMQPNWIKVAKFLKIYQEELHKWRRRGALAQWAKATNITKHNTAVSNEVLLEETAWAEKKRHEAAKFNTEGLTYTQKRMMKVILRSTSLSEKNLRQEIVNLLARISNVYSKAKVCNKRTRKCYHYEPGLIKLFRTSHNYDELLWAWKGWRDAIGPKIRKDWIKAEKLANKGAKEHGYHDVSDYNRKKYEDPTFESDVDLLWKRIEPFYKQLHAYVRYKLHEEYGDRVSLSKPIPAHLLGGTWAMSWSNILDKMEPYPKAGGFEVTRGLKEKNVTVQKLFTLADQFYSSIGLPEMTPQFWNYSMFTRPKDNRSVVCYASASNLEGDDVRVKMCAAVTSEYFYVAHHEMGHCQYYLAYNRHQPELFQSGANHGFHEAIGDTAALSVISPTHLEKLGILKGISMTEKQRKEKDLNFLMQKALEKLAFFPYAMTMAKWRWDVDRGIIKSTELNSAWWRYRKRYQGLMPPIKRTEADFDPGCKYHIANFVPYIRYFISHILQFQFFEALCDLASFEGPLHRCDFAGSKRAGEKFAKMLQMGSSKPWPYALRTLTNTTKMNADSTIRYFAPLLKWLKAENKRLGNKIGWD